ncbi:hypothetical protein OKW43_008326 [Paraburkholderia sp. WC7.3g]
MADEATFILANGMAACWGGFNQSNDHVGE